MRKYLLNLVRNLCFLLLCCPSILCARQVDSFYGAIEVHEEVLLELIDSPIFQRLKNIHQYGVAYYTTHSEEYNRYDHSIGVFAILRARGAPLEEQIAGLLHDVSHTVFSHVGDWIFGKENLDEDYQNSIHASFLVRSGLEDILKKYDFTVDQILPKQELFPALENDLPNLSADRIDYNIQGAYYQGFINRDEAQLIFNDLQFVDNRWASKRPDLMRKLADFSIFMTQNCWGSPVNYVTSRWLADAILQGIDQGIISYEELHFGIDQTVWDKLMAQKDPIIELKMKMIMDAERYFSIVDTDDEADFIVKSKFRAIDPWIWVNSKCVRLSLIDDLLFKEYEKLRLLINKGWAIKFNCH